METRKYSCGEVIFSEDIIEALDQRAIYQVKTGKVDIIANYKLASEKKLTTLQPGAYFGELALIMNCPHSATAVAAEDCEITLVGLHDFFENIKKDPSLIIPVVKNLGFRLRSLTNDYMEVCRTLKEYGANGSVGEKSGSLWKRLFKFSNFYTKNGKTKVGTAVPELERGMKADWMDGSVYFETNEIIFKQGEPSSCMYYIVKGDVAIYSSYGVKDQKLLTKLGDHTFFGEIGLLGDDPRSATAVAIKNGATIDRISLGDLERLVSEDPVKVDQLMNHLARRLVSLTSDYLKACGTAARVIEYAEGSGDFTLSDEEQIKMYMEMEVLGSFVY